MSGSGIRPTRTPTGDPAWLVDGYDDVKALLHERLLGRAHRRPEQAARMSRSALFGGPMGTDPEVELAHSAERRRSLAPAFSARRMEMLRPRVATLVEGLLDEFFAAGPPADLHERVSFPLPALVICELLGVPYADRDAFRRYADEAADTADEARSQRGVGELWAYMTGLVERKRTDPADDVLSDLVRSAEAEGRPAAEVAPLGAGLLFAGFETTVAAIDRAMVLLLTHREQWDALCADPGLVTGAVEETLRCDLPNPLVRRDAGGGLPRYAASDLDVDGVRVADGDLVLLALHAANLDERRFADPLRFDITRSPNPHLTFGHGPRFCLGAPLARMELAELLGALAHRRAGLRLATALDELRTVPDRLAGGLAELPLTW